MIALWKHKYLKETVMKQIITLFTIAFLTLTSYAQQFEWTNTYASTVDARGTNIHNDGDGNVIIVGSFEDDIDIDGTQLTSVNSKDLFVIKNDPLGNLNWHFQIQGDEVKKAEAVATDDMNNVFVVGDFEGTVNFDINNSNVSLTAGAGEKHGYICKLDQNGNFQWVQQIETDSEINIQDIDIYNNDVFITGEFNGTTDFDPGAGNLTFNVNPGSTGSGNTNVFFAKYDNTGNVLFAKHLEGASYNYCSSIRVNQSGEIIIYGDFLGQIDADPDAVNQELIIGNSSAYDIFFAKYNAAGDFVWVKHLEDANAQTFASNLDVDASGNIIICGELYGEDVDFGLGTGTSLLSQEGPMGYADLFIAKYTGAGDLAWTNKLGGTGFVAGLVTTFNDQVLVSGSFVDEIQFLDGNTTITNNSNVSGTSISMGIIDENGSSLWLDKLGNVNADLYARKFSHDGSDLYLTGFFNGSVDFSFDQSGNNYNSNGVNDVFLTKINPPTNLNVSEFENSSISVFPNPTTNRLNISIQGELKVVQTSIYSLEGRQLLERDKASTTIDISALPKGTYVLKIKTENAVSQQRFVKM